MTSSDLSLLLAKERQMRWAVKGLIDIVCMITRNSNPNCRGKFSWCAAVEELYNQGCLSTPMVHWKGIFICDRVGEDEIETEKERDWAPYGTLDSGSLRYKNILVAVSGEEKKEEHNESVCNESRRRRPLSTHLHSCGIDTSWRRTVQLR